MYQNNLKEHFLVDLHELLVPLLDIGRLLAGIGLVVLGLGRVAAVVVAPLNDFAEDSLVYLAMEQKASAAAFFPSGMARDGARPFSG